jgi:protein-tyrosine phosphatase
VIDLHCHLLPGVDDGPPDLDTALELARLQVAAGVETVAVTPHVSPDVPTEPDAIEHGVAELTGALTAAGIPLTIATGAEIDVRCALELQDEELRRLALGGGPWLLVEAPLGRVSVPLELVVGRLLDHGHAVLLAHPERSPAIQRDPALLRRLVGAGVLTQLTATSFTGRFGGPVQRFAERLLDEGLVHSVASDAHDPRRRTPGMREPLLEAGLGEEAVRLLTETVPAAVLAGDEVPAVGRLTARRRAGLRRLLSRR